MTVSPEVRTCLDDHFGRLASVVTLAGIGCLVWMADCQYGVTLLLPFDLFALGLAVLVSLPHLGTSLGTRTSRRLFASGLGTFALALLILSCVDQSAEKAMNRLSEKIRPGMTRIQVEQLAKSQFPAGRRFGVPHWEMVDKPPCSLFSDQQWVLSTPRVAMVVTFSWENRVLRTEVGD